MYHAIICKLFQCMLIEIGCVGCLKNFPSCVNDRAKEVPIGGRPPAKDSPAKSSSSMSAGGRSGRAAAAAAAAAGERLASAAYYHELTAYFQIQQTHVSCQYICSHSSGTFKSNRLV